MLSNPLTPYPKLFNFKNTNVCESLPSQKRKNPLDKLVLTNYNRKRSSFTDFLTLKIVRIYFGL